MGIDQFKRKKARILLQLEVPSDEYADASPKGSVDEPIRGLIEEINRVDTLITTSSCSGRVSVYVEGAGKPPRSTPNGFGGQTAEKELTSTGKGGGRWAFVSHGPIDHASPECMASGSLHDHFGLQSAPTGLLGAHDGQQSLVHFKFEPMILHIMAMSVQDAQNVLSAALAAGFRESGAVSLGSSPMVAVRSNGLAFDSIIGFKDNRGCLLSLVNETYLQTLVLLANSRFKANTERIQRFRTALLCSYASTQADGSKVDGNLSGEERLFRREENKRHGLSRQAKARAAKEANDQGHTASTSDPSTERDIIWNLASEHD